MQDINSSMCSSFVIFVAHLNFGTNFNGDAFDFVYMKDT